MVQSKVLKQLSILEQRKFDDEDIVEDIQFLNERLQASVQDLRYSSINNNFKTNFFKKNVKKNFSVLLMNMLLK